VNGLSVENTFIAKLKSKFSLTLSSRTVFHIGVMHKPTYLTSSSWKQTPTAEIITAFPVLTQPRQRIRSTAGASVTTQVQPKSRTTTTLVPNKEKPQTHTKNSKNQKENCQASVSINNETPEPLVDPSHPYNP
jgi:hypothetical protein